MVLLFELSFATFAVTTFISFLSHPDLLNDFREGVRRWFPTWNKPTATFSMPPSESTSSETPVSSKDVDISATRTDVPVFTSQAHASVAEVPTPALKRPVISSAFSTSLSAGSIDITATRSAITIIESLTVAPTIEAFPTSAKGFSSRDVSSGSVKASPVLPSTREATLLQPSNFHGGEQSASTNSATLDAAVSMASEQAIPIAFDSNYLNRTATLSQSPNVSPSLSTMSTTFAIFMMLVPGSIFFIALFNRCLKGSPTKKKSDKARPRYRKIINPTTNSQQLLLQGHAHMNDLAVEKRTQHVVIRKASQERSEASRKIDPACSSFPTTPTRLPRITPRETSFSLSQPVVTPSTAMVDERVSSVKSEEYSKSASASASSQTSPFLFLSEAPNAVTSSPLPSSEVGRLGGDVIRDNQIERPSDTSRLCVHNHGSNLVLEEACASDAAEVYRDLTVDDTMDRLRHASETEIGLLSPQVEMEETFQNRKYVPPHMRSRSFYEQSQIRRREAEKRREAQQIAFVDKFLRSLDPAEELARLKALDDANDRNAGKWKEKERRFSAADAPRGRNKESFALSASDEYNEYKKESKGKGKEAAVTNWRRVLAS